MVNVFQTALRSVENSILSIFRGVNTGNSFGCRAACEYIHTKRIRMITLQKARGFALNHKIYTSKFTAAILHFDRV